MKMSYSDAEAKALQAARRAVGVLEYNPKRGYSMDVRPRSVPSSYPSRGYVGNRFSGRLSS